MKRVLAAVVLTSIPVLMMLQVLQAYRYAVASEDIAGLERLQAERLDENNKLLAGIAVYDSPERIYGVAEESLGLRPADPENVLQVRFADEVEVLP